MAYTYCKITNKKCIQVLQYSSVGWEISISQEAVLYGWEDNHRSGVAQTTWLVGWSLMSLFSTNTAISQMKGQGWRVILLPSEGRPAIYLPQPWPPFCSAATQKGKGREAHLNYYATAYNRGRQYHTARLN